ncbi:hypothetical protein H072_74 [Dactylellina haptotyla CBS 200.50]|uniref:Uncharacterized protein n=1 Tax=Dactylellina haptotyla (strain CBS 200.50) TaxID=1284197 RepID=S8C2K5_DACHA|nr:hypothetical protein H072_74 [Dactylellina haptotyla CBS 200.50]
MSLEGGIVRQLSYKRLYAGSYEADDTAVCVYPPYEKPPPVILSLFGTKKGRIFLKITFTNWCQRQCELTVPLDKCSLNVVVDNVLYIHNFELGGDSYKKLMVMNNSSTAYETVGTSSLIDKDMMETPPRIISRSPINLLDLLTNMIVLRDCMNSVQDQMEFAKDLGDLGALITQVGLRPSLWSGGHPEANRERAMGRLEPPFQDYMWRATVTEHKKHTPNGSCANGATDKMDCDGPTSPKRKAADNQKVPLTDEERTEAYIQARLNEHREKLNRLYGRRRYNRRHLGPQFQDESIDVLLDRQAREHIRSARACGARALRARATRAWETSSDDSDSTTTTATSISRASSVSFEYRSPSPFRDDMPAIQELRITERSEMRRSRSPRGKFSGGPHRTGPRYNYRKNRVEKRWYIDSYRP